MLKIKFFLVFICIHIIPFTLKASDNTKIDSNRLIQVDSWLKIGPLSAPMPVFHQVKNMQGKTFDIKDLLQFEPIEIDDWWPEAGESLQWDHNTSLIWQKLIPDSDGVKIQPVTSTIPEIAYLASYIDARRYTKAKIKVSSAHLFQVYLDGKMITAKTGVDKAKNDSIKTETGNAEQELKLETGKHLLLIKALHEPGCQQTWRVNASIEVPTAWEKTDLAIDTSPSHHMNIKLLLESVQITGVSISPCGELAAVSFRQTLPPTNNSESWLELRRTQDGSLIQTYRGGMNISDLSWAPTGKRFSYSASTNGTVTLWLVDLEHGTTVPILQNIKNLGSYFWSPDGTFIVYSITEEAKSDSVGIKRLEGMPDRWPGWRDRSFLYRVQVPEGTRQRLTAGALSTSLNSLDPDNKKLLFTCNIIDFTERPYSRTELYVLDLETMQPELLWTGRWFSNAQWSPDGGTILMTGGPSMFGELGINVPAGMIPNDYDIQAYLFDPMTKKVEPISRNFDPSIQQAIWSRTENCIYFTTTDRAFFRLYRYDLKNKNYNLVDTGVEVLDDINIALNQPVAVYMGSSANTPPKACVLDLKKKKYRVLAEPATTDFTQVTFGNVEHWTFKNAMDVEIEGCIYYPPDFDPDKKYPAIVYYYGGTSPVTRDFGGRYPKNLWAAQGYVVYVLQPGGTTGFGQAFSALHVNDWGKIVIDEIIDGTKKFLATHPFVDEKRLGCIGASYGGFMTMLLVTRTDMFATAVSHAGISMLSSYWGEGYWGYLYSAVATANSFPWNRQDLYVDQSPLFHADNINTPLLLLHGAMDTNVPPGESIQLYTALKLLGKEVEYLQVSDQDHHIMRYDRRITWTKAIMAWFDRWLKDQPEWWDELFRKSEKK